MDFTGAVTVKTNHADPSTTNRATVAIDNSHSLGGPLAAFAYNSITLTTYGTIWTHNDVALDVGTRGVYVSGQGQFEVDEGAVLTLHQQLTVNGTLHKADCGFVAAKTATPFDFANCPNGKVPVSFALPDDYEEHKHTLTAAICTVPASTGLTPASFAVAQPSGTRTAVTARANADGTVTYLASIGAAGFTVLIR